MNFCRLHTTQRWKHLQGFFCVTSNRKLDTRWYISRSRWEDAETVSDWVSAHRSDRHPTTLLTLAAAKGFRWAVYAYRLWPVTANRGSGRSLLPFLDVSLSPVFHDHHCCLSRVRYCGPTQSVYRLSLLAAKLLLYTPLAAYISAKIKLYSQCRIHAKHRSK